MEEGAHREASYLEMEESARFGTNPPQLLGDGYEGRHKKNNPREENSEHQEPKARRGRRMEGMTSETRWNREEELTNIYGRGQ